jgi:excisionase family DNA binding protein
MGRRPAGLLQRPIVPKKSPSPAGDPGRVPATITVKQAARAIPMGEQAVRRAVDRGELDAVRVGGRVLILRKPFCEKFELPLEYDFGDA